MRLEKDEIKEIKIKMCVGRWKTSPANQNGIEISIRIPDIETFPHSRGVIRGSRKV